MSFTEKAVATARLGFLEYRAASPWHVVLTAEWPRVLLQCLFFTVLGRVTAGEEGGRFAFVGSVAMVIVLSTVTAIGDVPAIEKVNGTFHRLQLSGLPVAGVFALRSFPWLANGMASAMLCLAIVGPATGNADLSLALLPTLPIFALITVTSAAMGLAAASPSVGRRAESVVANGLTYLLIATAGLLIPVGQSRTLDMIGSVLPVRHGVLAIRAFIVDQPWLDDVIREVAIGGVWAMLAYGLYRRQAARSRVDGTDDFV
ncbi:ABC-2 type transport system permease protein [Nonomuraea thailandensis]|uniref:ABC-2 type transport system permease protein n=1 Tax=Nonomuraea thailandensis TaxID=1188745 RepID=A0A9X2JXP2_9ACTN|nr:ABC transporter permease [Nonomuraea thailandensis]MCP2353272.1 ABC-2 type transport system permease protein [Nonomuraea thailandensis]